MIPGHSPLPDVSPAGHPLPVFCRTNIPSEVSLPVLGRTYFRLPDNSLSQLNLVRISYTDKNSCEIARTRTVMEAGNGFKGCFKVRITSHQSRSDKAGIRHA
jgi:hypothetical protein